MAAESESEPLAPALWPRRAPPPIGFRAPARPQPQPQPESRAPLLAFSVARAAEWWWWWRRPAGAELGWRRLAAGQVGAALVMWIG